MVDRVEKCETSRDVEEATGLHAAKKILLLSGEGNVKRDLAGFKRQ